MWFEVFVLSWMVFWFAAALGIDVAENRFHYFKDALRIYLPLIIASIFKLIWG